jgi:archaellum component FlaG (FlaF/FlaG flagellin family)
VTISPNINGARVYINGELVGSGSITRSLTPGQYSIRIEAPGYIDFTTTVSVSGNQTVSAELRPSLATLALTVPDSYLNRSVNNPESRIRVWIDGEIQDGQTVQVRPGNRSVRITSGGLTVETTFNFRPGQTYELRPVLNLLIE